MDRRFICRLQGRACQQFSYVLLNAEDGVMWVSGELGKSESVKDDTYPLAVSPVKMQKINL